ncbi:MAG: murein biosynthesis integral membrane protein MurJ [Alphaproteobacteria bacterium]|nr:murein biosynthesis integral membrane protein MurJ [Alphaproteobacteria bacterium]
MRLVRAIATVGGYTGVSRIFGLVRESLMSHIIGASPLTDAFLVAFKFPNFFRRFFAEGAFNASFVPQFSGQLASEGLESAKLLAERVMAVLGITLFFFVIVIVIATPWVMGVIAPGFSATPERLEMAITFTRITFPYIFFISIAALLSGVLNSLDRFAAAAAAPIILNIIMIGAMLIFSYADLATGKALSWGVFLAGILQLAWLYWECWRTGFRLKIRRPRLTPEVRKVIRLMIPGAIGAGVMNINLLLDMVFASLLASGSISYLHYADRLNQLPLSLFGIAMGTALLPSLSRQIRLGEEDKARATQGLAVELSLQLTIPAALGFILLSYPIIDLLYGLKGDEVAATAAALAAFATGIPAYVLSKVFVTGFFARQDTKTPVKIAVISILCNLILNIILMGPFAHVGLAMATSIAAWINAGLQLLILHKRGWFFLTRQVQVTALKVFASAAVMGGGIVFARNLWLERMPETLLLQIVSVFGIIFCGMIIFAGMGQLTGAFNLTHIRQALRRN